MLQRRSVILGTAAMLGGAGWWSLRGDSRSVKGRLADVLAAVSTDEVPGTILLVEGNEINFREAVGVADLASLRPIDVAQTLRAGSICKTYVAAASVLAADDGLINLDDPVSRYIDARVLAKLPAGLDPTLRQLLTHRSGIPDYYTERFYLEDWDRSQPLTTELVLHAIRGLPATGQAGVEVQYSNTNFHLVALALEAVEGKPLSTILTERILHPLGLRQTWYDQQFPPGDVIHGYGSPLDPWEDTFAMRENSGPDGGMFMTPADLAAWLRALYAPDGAMWAVGSRLVAEPIAEKPRKLQGLGTEILVSKSGERIFGHTGGLDGYLTAGFYVPKTDSIVVLHMNRSAEEVFSTTLGQVLRIALE